MPLEKSLTFVQEGALRSLDRDVKKRSFDTTGNDGNGSITSSPDVTSAAASSSVVKSMTSEVHTTHDGVTAPLSDDDTDKTGLVVGIAITITAIVVFVFLVFLVFKKRVYLYKFARWRPVRARRSSTNGSRAALDTTEMDPETPDQHRKRMETDEMFTIEDFEEDNAEREEGDGYYYDEVFGTSHFEDEATNKAVRQLTSEDGEPVRVDHEDEMLDFDFETLGIKILDYKNERDRTNTA